METAVLALFAASLAACLVSGLSILWALLLGFILFFACGLRRHTARDMLLMAWNGVKTVRSVLFIFLLIGVITALWRACGTIPSIVSLAVPFCGPQWMVLASFLLCAAVSFLTGTSFGTAATMGVICAALADSMGVPALYIGGAVLSGAFFGDRWSPMSTSALLVAALTKTKLYDNLPLIWRTGLAPLLIACAAFGAAGALLPSHSGASDAASLFAASFDLHPAVLLPAAAVLLLSLLRVNVKTAMAVSILLAAALAVCLQHVPAAELLRMAVFGYHPAGRLEALLGGGGLLSMAKVFCIVCLSSSYAGIFAGTGMLRGLQKQAVRAARRLHPYGAVLAVSVISSMIACNQTLAIMLTHQLCGKLLPHRQDMMTALENTAVPVPALIPWSIAGAVPLAAIGAPGTSLLTAWYLWAVVLWNLFTSLKKEK